MKIGVILDQIDLGAMALPEFQRGYVWNRNQVRELMNSLYRGYPVGSLLVWVTQTDDADTRGDGKVKSGPVELILDGQQRITSLYGIIRGTPPPFFEGNAKSFTDLYFNVEEEVFEFYGPIKMQDNPHWISVTELMQQGVGPYVSRINTDPELAPHLGTYIDRLNAINNVKNLELHIEKVTGADKTVDVVVNIFNKVNSGGTKLSKGDLALARICAESTEARDQLRLALKEWKDAGFNFKMDWLLRCINCVTTGEALFSALKDVSASEFQKGFKKTKDAIDYMLNVVDGRLGLDHDRVLGSRYAFAIMSRYVVQNGGSLIDNVERDKLLYWYINASLWGRFTGSTESYLNQDLAVMEEHEGALERLIEQLRRFRGDLLVRSDDFASWSKGARFYHMLYLLTRVGEARDWGNGLPLKANMRGRLSRLDVHHIFPRSRLYDVGYDKAQVNALPNFCFLTQTTNLKISNRYPEEYFPEVESNHPGALASQWIPMDENLWKMENYPDFLKARQELLAKAANDFLSELLGDEVSALESQERIEAPVEVAEETQPVGSIESPEEEELLAEVNNWVVEQGLPEGELSYEVVDEQGVVRAYLDIAWPEGIQTGFSKPVAILIDEDTRLLESASAAGFAYFTDPDRFKLYVEREILAMEPEFTAEPGI